jgi:inner membrane transporter RhtA
MSSTFDSQEKHAAWLRSSLQIAAPGFEDGDVTIDLDQPVTPDAPSEPPRTHKVSPSALGAVAVGAGFHYLGPSFAVLLFAHVGTLGVAWLRLASAAVVLAAWRRPWRVLRAAPASERRVMLSLGAVLAGMNAAFYLALDRAPLATVASIEFLGVVALAAYGVRSRRNSVALALVCGGVALLTEVSLTGSLVGLVWAAANCLGFVLYVVLGHRISGPGGVDRLAVAVVVGAVLATPLGVAQARPALTHPAWLIWGIAVGFCSTVIPYVADQVAMARLPRASYALMLALLPVTAALCGVVVLGQVPSPQELVGITLVGTAVGLHRPAEARG